MAKVYEAMLLSQEEAPEATKKFLRDYNFSTVIPDPNLSAEEQDPLDLAALGLLPADPQLLADSVEINVGVAAAIADSVSNLTNSIEEESLEPTLPSPLFAPPVEMPTALTTRGLVPELYRNEFQQLSEIVMRSATQRTLQIILVCGVEPNDHADFVLENLSLALAENPDLRIARFGLVSPPAAALSMNSPSHLQIKIRRTAIANLCEVVPLDRPLPLGQLLRECDIEKMMEMLKRRFDFVLLETDAVNWTDDVAIFAGKTDGVILVAQNIRGQAMNIARQKLREAGAQVLGAVLSRSREPEQLQRVA
jgi:hypothetical protein